MRRATGLFSTAILLDIWETRAGRVLRVFGLDSVRTTILTLAVLATLIPALVTGVASYRQNSRAIRERVDEQLGVASAFTAREIDLWLKARQYDLRVFATSYEVTDNVERTTPQTRQRLANYLGSVNERFPDYAGLVVVAPDGRIVGSSDRAPGSLAPGPETLRRARAGEVVLGEPVQGDSGGAPTMEVAVPIVSPTGRFVGVLAGRLDFRGIENVLRDRLDAREDRVVVVRSDGTAILVAGSATTAPPVETLRALQRAESTTVTYTSADGTEVLGAASPVPLVDWVAIAELPTDLAYGEIRRLRNASVLLVLMLLGVVGSLAYALGLLIVQPLSRLTLASDRVARGDLDVDVPLSGGGELLQLTGVFNDMVRRLREGRDELERLSVTDELTGLANRRRLMAEIGREVTRSLRNEHPFAILMLDVDRFKSFNDSYGHQAGDFVLKRLAITLRKCVRDVDTVARYGGEEFMVILPETAMAEAKQVAERIRATTEADRYSPAEGVDELNVTVSIGLALFPAHGDSLEALIAAADDALYRSKEGGRNRVTAAKGPGKKG